MTALVWGWRLYPGLRSEWLRDGGVGAGVAWGIIPAGRRWCAGRRQGFPLFIYRWFGRRVVAPCEGVPACAGMTGTGARGDSGLRRNDGLEAAGMAVRVVGMTMRAAGIAGKLGRVVKLL